MKDIPEASMKYECLSWTALKMPAEKTNAPCLGAMTSFNSLTTAQTFGGVRRDRRPPESPKALSQRFKTAKHPVPRKYAIDKPGRS
jgi:hypothetical protein